jgi:hypothetical protein
MNPGEREHQAMVVRRRAADRERKRLVEAQERRMKGDRRTQHVFNAIVKRAKKGSNR